MNDMTPQQMSVEQVIAAKNLAPMMDAAVLATLGQKVIDGYETDLTSMAEWRKRYDRAIELATLAKQQKDYPWQNASNIRFPLITSAALQYNARAYPAIVPSSDVVKCAVQGADKDGNKANRAGRVARFMTWQLTVDTREWERGTDQLTLQLPIVGDLFRKVWWDVSTNRVRSQIRMPGVHIVVNAKAQTLATAPRVSDKIELYPHEIETRVRIGRFIDPELPQKSQDEQEPELFIEQLMRHDMDGDGYEEPYIVTVHCETRKVVRVVAAYTLDTMRLDEGGTMVACDAFPYLIHYQFMPAMDGGFFGTGMGLLLGDISDTIDTTLNLIVDSGHLASLGGGFIGTNDLRIKGGAHKVRPGEFKMIGFSGADIRAGLVSLDFPGPSPVLFQVLGLMIEAGREITSVSNVMTGDMGRQNMPVGTVMALIEQGQMVFTASYKRIFRAMQDEFELIARLNHKHLSPQRYQAFLDEPADPKADFDLDDMDILPVADPKSVTSMQRMGRAQFLLELATEGHVDRGEAIKRVLDAAGVENPEALAPKPDEMQMAMMGAQQEMMILEIRLKEAELEEVIANTQLKLAQAEKTMAEAEVVPIKARLEVFKASMEGLREKREAIEQRSAGRVAGKPGDNAGAGGSARRG